MADLHQTTGSRRKGNKRRIRRTGIRIDMTPMVDVAFLLLTFFMVTTAFRRPQTIEITIPADKESRREVRVQESNLMQVMINRDQRFYIKPGRDDIRPVDKFLLFAQMTGEIKNNIEIQKGVSVKDRNRLILVFKMHPQSPYEQLVFVLDELNRSVDSLNKYYGLNQPAEKLVPRFTFVPMNSADMQMLEKVNAGKP